MTLFQELSTHKLVVALAVAKSKLTKQIKKGMSFDVPFLLTFSIFFCIRAIAFIPVF